jgi:hypothetical protein
VGDPGSPRPHGKSVKRRGGEGKDKLILAFMRLGGAPYASCLIYSKEARRPYPFRGRPPESRGETIRNGGIQ